MEETAGRKRGKASPRHLAGNAVPGLGVVVVIVVVVAEAALLGRAVGAMVQTVDRGGALPEDVRAAAAAQTEDVAHSSPRCGVAVLFCEGDILAASIDIEWGSARAPRVVCPLCD